ncbi:MAG: hypothetical protein ABI776_00955 [Nocardioidaceae bacterium]
MSDEPGSGNQWEPPVQPGAIAPAGGRTETAAAPVSRSRRGKVALAAVAAVFLIGGGAGGYAVGHAGGGRDAQPSQQERQVAPAGGRLQPPPGDGQTGHDRDHHDNPTDT